MNKRIVAIMMVILLAFALTPCDVVKVNAEDSDRLTISKSVEKSYKTTGDTFIIELSTDKAGVATGSLKISGISNEVKLTQFKGTLVEVRDAMLKGDDAIKSVLRGFRGVKPDTEESIFSFGSAKSAATSVLIIDLENARAQSGTEVSIVLKANITEPTVEVEPIVNEKTYQFVLGAEELYWPMSIESLSKFSMNKEKRFGSYDWCLCDSNKKEIVSDKNPEASSLNYPVIIDKGNYYVKTKLSSTGELELGAMSFDITPVSESIHSNNTKGSAKTIKLGKKYSDIYTTIPSDEPHYYKFTLKKTKKVKLTYSKDDDVGITFGLYKKNGKYVSSAFVNSSSSNSGTAKWGLTYKKNIKLKKGTYYIMLEKGRDTCDGKYTFKIK